MSSNWSNASTSANVNPTVPSGSSNPLSKRNDAVNRPASLRSQQPFNGSIISQHFNSPITPREEELQRLLAQERQRSEQRRMNYATLKEEHLKLQNEFLTVQAEMKHILEETVYFKEKKNYELEELLQRIDEKAKQTEKLEKQLKDNEPEIMRMKLAAELEEPMKQMARKNERIIKERDKAIHENQLVKQQLEHTEREHLDSIERIKLSYEAEVNVAKKEKEEIRARLVEACQVPDVKRLIEMSEANSKLTRKLTSAQNALEQAEAQYREIQRRIEEFIVEQDQKEKLHENELKQAFDQLQSARQDAKSLRSKVALKQAENDDLIEELSRMKRVEERLRLEAEQTKIKCEQEKDEERRTAEVDRSRIVQESHCLREQIKRLKYEVEEKEETVQTLHRELSAKNKEIEKKITSTRKEEMDKIVLLEEKRRELENSLKDSLHGRQVLKLEVDKLRRQAESQNSSKLSLERELIMLQAKLESQAESIEEFEKMRRQHGVLHEELNRLRSESYDLAAANKELTRVNTNSREELARMKVELTEAMNRERQNSDELKVAQLCELTKLNRRFEEERADLREKVIALERENAKMKVSTKSGAEIRHGLNEYNRLRARQYSKIANRLGTLLEQLKIDESETDDKEKNQKLTNKRQPSTTANEGNKLNNHKRELDAIQMKQEELESCLEDGAAFKVNRRWKIKLND